MVYGDFENKFKDRFARSSSFGRFWYIAKRMILAALCVYGAYYFAFVRWPHTLGGFAPALWVFGLGAWFFDQALWGVKYCFNADYAGSRWISKEQYQAELNAEAMQRRFH